MPAGGTLTFAISRQEISGADIPASFDALPGEYICLDIIDTGVGIPEDMIKQVITPFFSTKPPGQGSGLGLSQAYGVVRQHNGFLTISSVVGAGTTVRLALPPVAPQAVSAGDRLQSAPSDVTPDGTFEGHGECVLLVEDSDLVRKAAIELLTSLGYETLAASSGEEGIEMFQQNSDQIKVVLSDLIMPGISGREVCHHIRRISPDVPLILFSGYTDSPEIAKMREEGIIDGFLGKPFSAREMGQLLKTILN